MKTHERDPRDFPNPIFRTTGQHVIDGTAPEGVYHHSASTYKQAHSILPVAKLIVLNKKKGDIMPDGTKTTHACHVSLAYYNDGTLVPSMPMPNTLWVLEPNTEVVFKLVDKRNP